MLVFDLSIDPDDLAALRDDELAARLAARPKPVRGLRTNASPIVLSYEEAPDHVRNRAPDIAELRRRAARIKRDEAFLERLIAAFVQTREEKESSAHVEEQIYDGFTGDEDQVLLDRFHEAEWIARAALVAQLADERLKALGQRLIHTEAPHVMSEPDRREFDTVIARRLMTAEGTVPWLTLPKAIEEANDLLAVAAAAEATLLSELRDYLTQRAEEAAALLA